jgi:hypothetical protein
MGEGEVLRKWVESRLIAAMMVQIADSWGRPRWNMVQPACRRSKQDVQPTFAVFKIKKGNLGLFQGARLIPHAPKLLDHVFGAGKKFRPRNRYDHETDDSKSYLVGIAMAFHRHRFRLSFWNTTRHS